MARKYKFNFMNWLRNIVTKVFKDTAPDISYENMDDALEVWLSLYHDEPSWLKDCHDKTLNLAASIATEFARLILIEFDSEITGSKRADFLNEQYKLLINNLRRNLEEACAVGGIIFKPYVENGKIKTDFITQDQFIPTAWTDDEITSAVFINRKYKNKHYYFRIEKQTYDSSKRTHKIESKFYMSSSPDNLGTEILAKAYPSYIDPDITFNDVDRPLFSFWRTPLANTIEKDNPLGVSVYSRAVKLIKEADLQWDRYLWEYDGGTLAIDADESMLRPRTNPNGNFIHLEMPKTKDRLFRRLVGNANAEKQLYEVFAPTLRDGSYASGINEILRKIEFACSLAYGTLSNPQDIDKTAEEIKSSKQRSFSVVSDMQSSLQTALENYIYILDQFATGCKLAPQGEYEVKFNWGDGILEDNNKEQAIRLQEVNSQIISKVEYRMWRYGETEEQAKQAIQKATANSGVTDFFGGS